MSRNYRSEALGAVHETMAGLHRAGAIGKRTMREFDETCLTPAAVFSPAAIRALRDRERVSQSVFAQYLNVTPGLVSQWERGEKRPSGPALKLLTLVRKGGIAAVA